jgi:threonine dehydrogenase-like Zn-dependent dehydrogenase
VHRCRGDGGGGTSPAVVHGKVLKVQAGSSTAIEWAIASVRKAGHVSIVGVYGPPWNLVNIGTAMNKGLTLRMNQCNVRGYMPHLLDLIRRGVVDAKAIITHRVPLEEVGNAYEIFARKLDGCIKPVLMMPGASP